VRSFEKVVAFLPSQGLLAHGRGSEITSTIC
jgi:hypothetical protein